jgi:hypothetical protein
MHWAEDGLLWIKLTISKNGVPRTSAKAFHGRDFPVRNLPIGCKHVLMIFYTATRMNGSITQ